MDTTLQYKEFPVINFIGNKERLARWIYKNTPEGVDTLLDLFCGGCSVSYFFKTNNVKVIANDAMRSSYMLAKALIENNSEKITEDEMKSLLSKNEEAGAYFEDKYSDVMFFKGECAFLDNVRANIGLLDNDYKKALAYTAMRRAMMRKMPYSRFNIPWELIKKLRDEELSYKRWGRKRAYHNLPFESHFSESIKMYDNAVFTNHRDNTAINMDAIAALEKVKNVDAVYFDPPYAGKMNDYYKFYGFLDEFIDLDEPKRPMNDFTKKATIADAFDRMFSAASHIPVWIISYNSRSFPKKDVMFSILSKHGEVKTVEKAHAYKLTNGFNKKKDIEYLFIVNA